MRVVFVCCDFTHVSSDCVVQDGSTPLMVAASMSRPSCVRVLLQAGCVAATKNNAGDTALTMVGRSARDRSGDEECILLLKRAEFEQAVETAMIGTFHASSPFFSHFSNDWLYDRRVFWHVAKYLQ